MLELVILVVRRWGEEVPSDSRRDSPFKLMEAPVRSLFDPCSESRSPPPRFVSCDFCRCFFGLIRFDLLGNRLEKSWFWNCVCCILSMGSFVKEKAPVLFAFAGKGVIIFALWFVTIEVKMVNERRDLVENRTKLVSCEMIYPFDVV